MKHGNNEFKKLRVAAGLSQTDVSKKLGFGTAQYISNAERNVSTFAFKHAKTLAKLFQVDAKVVSQLIEKFRTDEFENRMAREKKQAGV